MMNSADRSRRGDGMGSHALRAVLLAAMALALAGCVRFGPEPPKALLTLAPAASPPAGDRQSGSIADAVVIDEIDADARINALRIPVRTSDAGLAYLKDAAWVERPSRLFRRLVSETVAARSGRLVLDEIDLAGQSRQRIAGRLVEFGYDARDSSASVVFEATRRSAAGAVETRRFAATEPGVPAEPLPVGEALNRAANRVAVEVAEWIG